MALQRIYAFAAVFTLVVIVLFQVWPMALEQLQWPVFIVLMLAIGLPHGAIDHIASNFLLGHKKPLRVSGRFLAFYLILMGVVAAVFWLSPAVGLTLFLAYSAYHFGQSQLYHFWPGSSAFKTGAYLLYGATILLFILSFGFEQAYPVIKAFYGPVANPNGIQAKLQWGAWGMAAFWALAFFDLAWFNKAARKAVFIELGSMAFILALCLFTNLWWSFIIYFAVWHSSLSFYKEYRTFSAYYHKSFWQLYKYTMPFTLTSVLGILLLIGLAAYMPEKVMEKQADQWMPHIFHYTGLPTESALVVFFQALAAITAPHTYFMARVFNSTPTKAAA